MNKPHKFRDWEEMYREEKVETMPWFHPDLDPDLAGALKKIDIRKGSALDLGTGPGTQAIALAERGFKVTATDISATAVKNARIKARKKGLDIVLKQDDILKSKLKGKFDFVFDRGCFHVMQPEKRREYVGILAGLVKPGGYLFVKCFSYLEKMEGGPYRFKPAEIKRLFSARFDVLSIEETVYHGTLKPLPKALFCTLLKP
jgi:2-polyprenyl-3-methyl-5-hydroxy-6-metoxy-1,4-benzoquinol methylase